MKLNKYELTSDKLPVLDKIYIGIDQSLTCTSIAILARGVLHIHRMHPTYTGVQRLLEIYQAFLDIINDLKLDMDMPEIAGAAIEGYAFSANGAKFNLGELGGVLRMALFQRSINSIEVPPTHLKKFLTGKGNVAKNLMMKELYKKYSLDVDDDNDCDAVALALVCAEFFEAEYHPVKTYQTDTHKACNQIVGNHPKPLDLKQYFAQMGDETLAQYEKRRKSKKNETK